jgi:hypothetical protein
VNPPGETIFPADVLGVATGSWATSAAQSCAPSGSLLALLRPDATGHVRALVTDGFGVSQYVRLKRAGGASDAD